MTQIVVPTLGESVTEATVAQWLKKEGEAVSADEPVVELETDKVTLEVNAPAAGVLSKIVAGEGSNVEVGALLAEVGEGSGVANDAPKEKAKATETPAPQKESQKAAAPASATESKQSGPAARKLMEERGITPSAVSGTGKGGRVTKGDVLDYKGKSASDVSPPQAVGTHPVSATAQGPREERVRMTKLRKVIASRLKEAQNTAAMLTTFNECDMGAVMDLRKEYKESFEKKHGVKLGFMSFFVKAAVNALKELPSVNASIDGEELVYKNYYDIGVAVSTPQGLIVPVVRDCDTKSMAHIEKGIMDVGTRARDGKLGMDELQGGTFTITNGGTFGSLMSTPILNTPQSGILGMHKIQQRPMAMPDGSVAVRPMMYLALSYDHRIIDGREAVTFLVRIKEAIEDPQRLLLDI